MEHNYTRFCAQLAKAKSEKAKILDLRFFHGYLLIDVKEISG